MKLLLLLLAAGGLAAIFSAQKGPLPLSCKVPKCLQPVAIDAVWEKAPWQSFDSQPIALPMGKAPEHLPHTAVKIAYDDDALYLIFRVVDRYVRAITTEHQKGEVWKDSCVEFFFTPGHDIAIGHFYLEMNCGGTMLFRFHGPNAVETIPQNEYGTMSIAHSLPKIVDPEICEPITWTLEYRLPLAILKKYCAVHAPATGVVWRANFYKCADASSHPHWLTWSPVDFPTPQFHLPEFFGTLEFE